AEPIKVPVTSRTLATRRSIRMRRRYDAVSGLSLKSVQTASASRGLRGRFHLFLVVTDLFERLCAGDVGDRSQRPGLAELSRRLPPALRPDAVLLAEERHEDLRLVLAEARQRLDPLAQLDPVFGAGPDVGRYAVVFIDDYSAELLHPGGHRAGITMYGGRA